MSQPLHVAFDLDGTLVDTAPDLVRALNAAIAPRGIDRVPLEAVRLMVGRGARALIREAYGRAGRPFDEAELEEALALFLQVYREGIADLSRPFPGVEAALDRLAASGARLSVCTNKPTFLASALLDALGLTRRFERVVGPDDVAAKKPDPGHLMAAFGGARPGRSVLVGDSETDALAARAAGVPFILYVHGYNEKPAEALRPYRLLEHYDRLEDALTGF